MLLGENEGLNAVFNFVQFFPTFVQHSIIYYNSYQKRKMICDFLYTLVAVVV